MIWKTVLRPGYLGKKRDEKYAEWNQRYGWKNWRLAWIVGEVIADFSGVCSLYEDAYFHFLDTHPHVLEDLISAASDVYDDAESNVGSGFDYHKQETDRTHIQDIAIRRSLLRLGIWFKGKELIQIRDAKGPHPLSRTLSPGRVPFHQPTWIQQPELQGWWHPGSVESFYQSNRVLQTKKIL